MAFIARDQQLPSLPELEEMALARTESGGAWAVPLVRDPATSP